MPTITSPQLIEEAKKILDRVEARGGSFNRETEARVSQLLKMAELARASEVGSEHGSGPKSPGQLFNQRRAQIIERTTDPAILEFFGGKRGGRLDESRSISITGGRIQEYATGFRWNGKPVGAITELRDFSAMMPEARTFTGLFEGSATFGGDTVPVGFIPIVFAAMKRTDQILEAANWDTAATADGRKLNIPSLTDTGTSAVTIAEAGAATYVNPTFGQLQFDVATTWTSQVIKTSVQLDQDAAPRLANTLADAFRIRFARGFGAACVNILLGDAPVGATANNVPPDEFDLMSLMGSVDPAYANAPGAGFAMNWTTFLAVVKTISTTGEGNSTAAFVLPKDDRGHYLFFGKPVYISPSLPDISTSPTPSIVFGDWSRFLIRHVPTEAVVRRYDELFMTTHQRGYEMLFRADAAIMHAGGSDDNPLKVLQCHS